jgi:hypothetical protein
MDDGYPFLRRLGLDEGADARAIRRAYARELKQVDQALDPQGFQDLRDCYETALAWVAWVAQEAQEAQEAQAAAPVAGEAESVFVSRVEPASGPGPAADPGPAPAMLGHHAFERFRSRFASLPTGMARGMEAAWIAALDAALADDDLVNFDARLAFELALAQLLAEGWQPGHEALFPTAAKRLGWDSDRRTLARLGMVGELLDLALDERLSFFAQDVQARARQRQVLSLLRAAAPCGDRRILAEMAVVELMLLRFPHWMPLIAPMAEVERWRVRYWARKGHAAAVPGVAPVRGGKLARLRRMVVSVVMGLAFMALLAAMFEAAGGGRASRQQHGPGSAADAARATMRYEEGLSQRQIDEIASRIAYRPGPHADLAKLRAGFDVSLDETGRVVGVEHKETAADPAFTAAVEKAIRESKPFPSWTTRRFHIDYRAEPKRRP